ncbi:MAG: Autotransporter-associated beta strand repeat protein, partial [Verrucomicrobiaceae bacterium]|nr:Autotransporter-associated beta strand repeat protein [Verrucomicrobiaceae bacterium]
PVEVYGTLQTGTGLAASYVNGATGNNANNIIIRPGGIVIVNDVAGVNVAGNQGRWSNSQAVELNGGTFRFNGAAGVLSSETVGTLNVSKGGVINVTKGATTPAVGAATLIVSGINRNTPITTGTAGYSTTTFNNGTGSGYAGAGTLSITGTAASLGIPTGTATSWERLVVTGGSTAFGGLSGKVLGGPGVAAGTLNAGMAPPWMIDAVGNTFLSYDPTAGAFGGDTGFQPILATLPAAPGNAGQVAYSNPAPTGALLAGTGTETVDITGAITSLVGNASNVYAIRTNANISTSSATTANTLTIASGGLFGVTNNIVIGQTVANAVPALLTLNFGAAGSKEAFLTTGSSNITMTINGQINAAGITRFANNNTATTNGNIVITSNGNNITAPVTINGGILSVQQTLNGLGPVSTGVFNGQQVILNGGQLSVDSGLGTTTSSFIASGNTAIVRALATLNSDIYVNGDANLMGKTVANGDIANVLQHVKSLTFADLGAAGGPTGVNGSNRDGVTLQLMMMYVNGTTALGAHSNNIQVDFGGAGNGNSVLGGQVTGGILNKYGNGGLLMASGTNSYSGGTVIWPQGNNTATSFLGSLIRTGTPFGTGPITANPGSILRIADPSNISGNAVTILSDGQGLSGIGLAYNGAPPTLLSNGAGAGGAAVNGQLVYKTSGDYGGTLTLDLQNYSYKVDQSTLGNGRLFLGGSVTATTNYFNQTLTAGLPDTVNTAPIFNGSTLTTPVYRIGAGGNQNTFVIGANAFENVLTGAANVQIGANTTANAAAQLAYINGNTGAVTLANRNNRAAGSMVFVNRDSAININNARSLGDASLVLNQSAGTTRGLRLNAPISNDVLVVGDTFLVDSGTTTASLRGNVNLSPSGVGGTRTFNIAGVDIGIEGVVSGAAGTNVIKTGATNLYLNGLNTYLGTTTLTAGTTYSGTSVLPNLNGALGNSDTPILMNGGNLALAGQVTLGRDLTLTASGILRGQTVNTSTVTGAITVASTFTLSIDSVNSTAASFQGGLVDVQSIISGGGIVQIGNDSVQGTVRLSGASTFTGGVNLRAARLQIGADPLYTGTATAPIILSGPLGTGTFNFGPNLNAAGGVIEAYGADRTIVNPLGIINTANNQSITFAGHNNLTFTRDWNISSDGTVRSRSLITQALQSAVTFSGNLSQTGAQGANLVKGGSGILVLSGTNTQQNILTTDGNYGTTAFIDNGILSVGADANLGLATVALVSGTGGQAHTAGSASDVRLRGGVLQATGTFATSRNLILTANSGIDVTSGQALTVNQAVTGLFALTKTGNGTLALNPAVAGTLANTINLLTIGGAPVAFTGTSGSPTQLSGTGGGTVSTTATGGQPFGTATVAINGGTLSLVGGATAQAITIPTLTYGSGSYIRTNPGATTTALTATTITRVNQGTLTLMPSANANLGSGTGSDKVFATGATTTTTASGTGTILAVPAVYVRQSGVGQDADFATYGVNGFQLNNANQLANNLTGAQAASLGVVTAATNVGTGAANTILDLRTSANISGTDGTSLLQITGGGLIMNGATAPVISANLTFGTTATPNEALVYVRDGQTGTSTLSGNLIATNFTKSGPGLLLISGTNNTMAPLTTGLRTMQINEGTIRFAGQSSLPSNRTYTASGDLNGANAITAGQIIISPMDTGALDLAGQSLTIAGLGGPAAATAATGNVINSGAAATLTVAPQNAMVSTFNGQISGNVALTTRGNGTLALGYNNTYTGGTTVGVGTITSGSGLYTPLGTLQINDFNSLGSGPVSLAGGILNVNDVVLGNEVLNNLLVTILGPGNGYNLTVAATNSLGGINTTSQIGINGAANWQGINNLTMSGPVLTITGASQGLAVNGITALSQPTTFNVNGSAGLFLGGQITGGQPVTKIGSNTLFLANTATGVSANNVSGWNVMAGTLEVRMSQGDASNPLGSGNTVQLNGGILNVKHDGDNLTDTQVITSFANNNLQIGSIVPATSSSYIGSANATLDTRALSAGANKTIQFNNLVFGGALGTAQLTFTAANTQNVEFLGGLQMLGRDAALSLTNERLTIDGTITGNGTLFRQGGAEFDINTNATGNTATGGTVIASNGDTYFAAFQGTARLLNATSKLGTGNISVQP